MRVSMLARTCVVALCLLSLVACSGGGDSTNGHNSNRDALEVERQARREADLQRERALTELARLKQQQREAEKKRWDEIEARRKAEAEARRQAEAKRQADLARLIAEQKERRRNEEFNNRPRTFLPWADYTMARHTDLGPWTDPGHGLSMALGHAAFGVRDDNGRLTPWFHGRLPEQSLYSNNEIGSFALVRWTGKLVGRTPDRRNVTGNATLGDFDFSGRSYPGSQGWNPGAARLTFSELQYRDTGATWGDGDLRYEVKLGSTFTWTFDYKEHKSSFFAPWTDCRHAPACQNDVLHHVAGRGDPQPNSVPRRTTFDAGVVRGLLLGPKHEAMAGTLQRDDLTAAFGGRR